MGRSDAKKILVVESDQDLRSGVCDLLEAEGYTAVSAPCYREALKEMSVQDPPGVIVYDCVPPCKSGLEFFTELDKLGARFSNTPILLMVSDEVIQRKYDNSRVSAFVMKPLNLDRFLEVVRDSFDSIS